MHPHASDCTGGTGILGPVRNAHPRTWSQRRCCNGVWQTLWRFWPVILLIIGVNIFLRDKPWLAGLIILLIMLATIGTAIWIAYQNPQAWAMAG